jgi:hypothetical protein
MMLGMTAQPLSANEVQRITEIYIRMQYQHATQIDQALWLIHELMLHATKAPVPTELLPQIVFYKLQSIITVSLLPLLQ